ncbi:hypothetical protein ADJ73_09865 [Arsenicicoccus sp. oral taxon 190]|nr:hypothetical protein ADJ73_09865 [Arsenicicoccus sp. oral taxon 190]
MTRRLLATVIGSEACIVLFGGLVAMALDKSGGGNGTTWLIAGSVLAVLCIVAAGVLRRPWGVTLGWLIHLATLAAALVVPMMIWVFLIFGGLWVVSMVQGAKIDDLSDEAQRRYDAEHGVPDGA